MLEKCGEKAYLPKANKEGYVIAPSNNIQGLQCLWSCMRRKLGKVWIILECCEQIVNSQVSSTFPSSIELNNDFIRNVG